MRCGMVSGIKSVTNAGKSEERHWVDLVEKSLSLQIQESSDTATSGVSSVFSLNPWGCRLSTMTSFRLWYVSFTKDTEGSLVHGYC